MALALSRTEDGRMLVDSPSFCPSSSLMSSSSSDDSSLLRVLESESVLAEEGLVVDSGSLSGFRSSDLGGDSEILGGVVDKMSGSENGSGSSSGSGFSVSSDSSNFSCFNSSVKTYRRRTSTTGTLLELEDILKTICHKS